MDAILLFTLAQGQGQPGSGFEFLIPIGLMVVMFYFLIIRPQKKRQEEHRKLVESLKKGQKVVTAGGIHGIITNVKDTTIVVKVDDSNNTKMEFEKGSIERINVGKDDEMAAPSPQAKAS